jgi:hypothetical protein
MGHCIYLSIYLSIYRKGEEMGEGRRGRGGQRRSRWDAWRMAWLMLAEIRTNW